MIEKLSFLTLRARRAVQLAQDGEWKELVARLQRRFAPAGPGPEHIVDPKFYATWRKKHFAKLPVLGALPSITFFTLSASQELASGKESHTPGDGPLQWTQNGVANLGLAAGSVQHLIVPASKRMAALSAVTTSFVAVVPVGCRPSERFLSTLAQIGQGDVWFGDSEHVAADGRLHSPFFRQGWSPERALEQPYVDGVVVYRTEHLQALGRPTPKTESAADYDLFLRATENARVTHIPELWSQRLVEPSSTVALPECGSKSVQSLVVKAALRRRKVQAEVTFGPLPGTLQVRPKVKEIAQRPTASLIIPFRDKPELLDLCLSSLRRVTAQPRYEVILVDNGSEQPTTHQTVRHWQKQLNARLLTIPGPFNYADLNNRAARVARGDVLVLLNNDTEIVDGDWLEAMVGWAQQKDIGAVGPMLLYGDRSIQHAGVLLGVQRIAIHSYQWEDERIDGYFGGAKVVTNPSAVTGACLAVQRKKFWEVGGLDDVAFKIAFNDLDLCLKLKARGYRTLFTPHARLIHHESKSRGTMLNVDEDREFHRRYRSEVENDPAYSPFLSRNVPDFRLR